MIAYRCLRCGCTHGWGNHPRVIKVQRHIRGAGDPSADPIGEYIKLFGDE